MSAVMLEQTESTIMEVLAQYQDRVKRAALFGAAARGDMTEESIVNMLVELLPDTRGIEFFGLYVDLKEALGREVDLITWDGLEKAGPYYKEKVNSETRMIYEQ